VTREGGDVVDDDLQLAADVEASAAQMGAWVVIKDGAGDWRAYKTPWSAMHSGVRQLHAIALAQFKRRKP
jgi:hypothetical protein